MKTNKKQRYVLYACAVVIALMPLFPPFHEIGAGGRVFSGGYGYLFVPPNDYATVNIGTLLMQWAGVLIIGGILMLALRDKE